MVPKKSLAQAFEVYKKLIELEKNAQQMVEISNNALVEIQAQIEAYKGVSKEFLEVYQELKNLESSDTYIASKISENN